MQPTIKSAQFLFYHQAIARDESPLFALPLDALRSIINALGANDPAHLVLKFVDRRFTLLTNKIFYERACEVAIKDEMWALLDWLYPEINPEITLTESAAKRGHFEVVVRAHEQVAPMNERGAFFAAQKTHLRVMQWAAADLGIRLSSLAIAFAAKNGNLEAIKWCLDSKSALGPTVCEWGAQGGNVAILKWLREQRTKWDPRTCAAAAQKGHLAVLQWLREQKCPWDEKTCYKAAGNGHFEVLKWARTNGCPWNGKTYARALKNKHTEIVDWAYTNGCPLPPMNVELTSTKRRGVRKSTICRYEAV